MSSGTEANPIELVLSSSEESDFSDAETLVDTPPSGTKEDPITLASDSEDESAPAPVSPGGSSKRPITLSDSESDDEPPKKKHSPSPPRLVRLNLTLAIPATTQQPPPLLQHNPATTTTTPEGNFVAPVIAKSARLTALLRACPSLPTGATPLPAHEQIEHEMRLVRNRATTATEGGAFLAWNSFAQPSRGTRECMVQSGLDWDDLDAELDGIENGLPDWKQPRTGVWARHGAVPMERRTPSLSREPSVFGEVEVEDGYEGEGEREDDDEDDDEWVTVGGEREEVVVVEVDDEEEGEDDEVVILKVDGDDEWYDGADY